MTLEKLTIKAREAVTRAVNLASVSGNPEVTPLHLLASLINDDSGTIPGVMKRLGIQVTGISEKITSALENLPRSSGGAQPALSRQALSVLKEGENASHRMKGDFVAT